MESSLHVTPTKITKTKLQNIKKDKEENCVSLCRWTAQFIRKRSKKTNKKHIFAYRARLGTKSNNNVNNCEAKRDLRILETKKAFLSSTEPA